MTSFIEFKFSFNGLILEMPAFDYLNISFK